MSVQKSLYDNETICNHFMILQENVAKLPLWQILCLCMINYVLNCIQWIRMLRVVLMNSKTHGFNGSGLITFGLI